MEPGAPARVFGFFVVIRSVARNPYSQFSSLGSVGIPHFVRNDNTRTKHLAPLGAYPKMVLQFPF